jgi:hypothetical protein
MRNGLIPSLVLAILVAADMAAAEGRYSLAAIRGAQSVGTELKQQAVQFYIRSLRQIRG